MIKIHYIHVWNCQWVNFQILRELWCKSRTSHFLNEWAALTYKRNQLNICIWLSETVLVQGLGGLTSEKIKAERLWGKCPIPFRLLAAKVAPKPSYLAPQPCSYPALWKEWGLWGFHFGWLVCNFSWDLWQYFQRSSTELVAQDAAECEPPRMQHGFSMACHCEQGVLVGALPFTGSTWWLIHSCLM